MNAPLQTQFAMDKDEFLNFLNQSNFGEFFALKNKFQSDLSTQLSTFILQRHSAIKNNPSLLSQLTEASEICAMMAFDALQRTLRRTEKPHQYVPFNIVPKLKTREESLPDLDELLKLTPETEHTYVKQIHWEEFEYRNQAQQYKIDIHNLIKKVMVAHFEEDILELEGQNFLFLDEYIFMLATESFIEKTYELSD
jgi:hypothetical protein